ncbi:hypothetical protein MJO52_06415 [Microbulbifer variabilis]|uniref:Uncharacterized protein n=1 Tax=Microbulbifer variabilis TaxID=266805 RepID=A0ABY4VEP7_9GAMM|nr:hypothetical protein [Microbulbifer variabilis]USD22766.1 hypothetical protein MJO52_06415 [Microbulbifer variabilis]
MIEIGKLGIIESGDEEGFQIKVLNDSENTGGFLILTGKDLNDEESEGFDSWVSSYSELESYFKESNWKIKWLKTGST